MEAPTLIFDHINQKVYVAQTRPASDKRVQEALEAQQRQITSASGSPAR